MVRYIYATKKQWTIGFSDGLTSEAGWHLYSGFNMDEGEPWEKSWKNNTTVTCKFLCGCDDGQHLAVDEGGSGEQRTEDALCQTTWIAVAAAAGVAIFLLIIGAVVWKTGKCNVFKKEIVENNEVYGAPENDYQYAKDQYNTKVFDDNDYYDN